LQMGGFSLMILLTFNKNVQVGFPAAPRGTSLSLLPLGPDEVRRFLPRRPHPDA
jgi:hypothetical protein